MPMSLTPKPMTSTDDRVLGLPVGPKGLFPLTHVFLDPANAVVNVPDVDGAVLAQRG